jgi:hypothetical protein
MHLNDEEMRAHMATLDDEQLSDFLAAIDAAEIIEKNKPLNLEASALYYAARIGWPIFPLKPRGKTPLTRHGFKDATRDLDQIRAWWHTNPDANIGTPTGPEGCGYDVIDVDGIEGHRSIADLKHHLCPPDCSAETFCNATGELPPISLRCFTPGGPGRHYYTPATGDGNASRYLPGLDYRGHGGYVVLPPSIGLNGRRYTWITRPETAAA